MTSAESPEKWGAIVDHCTEGKWSGTALELLAEKIKL